MIDNFLNLVRENRVPNIEKIAFITLRALSKLIREIYLHLLLAGHLVVQVLNPDLVPVWRVDEVDFGHFEEPLLPGKNGFQMIFRNLPVRKHVVLTKVYGKIIVSKVV